MKVLFGEGEGRRMSGEDAGAPPVRTRRRGAALERAIYEATIAECAESGYGRLTLRGVAERARTGKAALYRRWSTPQDLLLDAFEHVLLPSEELPETGDLREELVAALRRMADALTGRTGPPAMVLLGDLLRHPELIAVFRTRFIEPRLEAIAEILRRAAERGEIPGESASPFAARTGPAQVMMHYLLNGTPPDDRAIEAMVDQVVLPALRAGRRAPGDT
ncbi:TetR/AcrR family transcriptional regulator [Streptomyces sparsogenes]|uniref:TetR/AcrR family transcriptional regulator n=1 Tax=Streptomyces sparsogenes TaxID=67365 RepID=UPI000D546077|nr:TetR family transcriptional regulator [Actinomycetota bacterium]